MAACLEAEEGAEWWIFIHDVPIDLFIYDLLPFYDIYYKTSHFPQMFQNSIKLL